MPCQGDSGLTWEEAHSCGASPSGLPEHSPRWFSSGEHPASDRHHQSEVIACSGLCACKPVEPVRRKRYGALAEGFIGPQLTVKILGELYGAY